MAIISGKQHSADSDQPAKAKAERVRKSVLKEKSQDIDTSLDQSTQETTLLAATETPEEQTNKKLEE
ncbi:MAG: hypothetical protein ACRDB1_00945, partial [Microcoleaceae cyanobacterium]